MASRVPSFGSARSRSTARTAATGAPPVREWPVRAVESLAGAPSLTAAIAVATVVAGSWGVTWWMGGAGAVAPHWFYLAIVLAAVRFGVRGAVVAGLVSGIVVGPLMPLDVDAGTAQDAGDWVSRTVFFVVLGALVGMLIASVATVRARLGDVARRERQLARQRVAFVDGISHEFRTPLTVIAGSARMLQRGDVAASAVPDLVDGMCHNVERLEALLDVLIVAGEGSVISDRPELFVTDLTDVVVEQRDARDDLGARERVRIGWHEPILVRGDRRLVSIAVGNVIDNAIRYSGAHAPVDCEVEVSSDEALLRVRDRGPGIDPSLARQCVEAPFAAGDLAEEVGHRLGVGLFAAGQAMRRVGGYVEIDFDHEGGTQVVLSLLRAQPADDVRR